MAKYEQPTIQIQWNFTIFQNDIMNYFKYLVSTANEMTHDPHCYGDDRITVAVFIDIGRVYIHRANVDFNIQQSL